MGVRAHRVQVPEESDTPGSDDYASAFAVAVGGTYMRSPTQWARATFEDAPQRCVGSSWRDGSMPWAFSSAPGPLPTMSSVGES
jgi:hypothetical protein